MKTIKLCYDDPDIFQTTVSSTRCDFILNHFEGFMQMYKTQGSTFWLRFLVSFKNHIEAKFYSCKKWLSFLVNHFQFIKVLNFIYISLHKKFIEGSNTTVKKLIHNLVNLALNSPSHLKHSLEQWLIYVKSCKQFHNIFQSLFGVSEHIEYNGFTAFIFTVYTDFFCALCAVFEHWHEANDITEEDLKKIDTKIIYWLPNYHTEQKIKPSCFEKYISSHWKESLQRMLLTDNIHNLFSEHNTFGCCEKFDKEKNIFKLFRFTNKHTVELMKLLDSEGQIDDSEESVHTITEINMKDVCTLKPQAALCTGHKKCFLKICHSESCHEPFMCSGESSCTVTCETKLKSAKKQEKKNGNAQETFWKAVTAEIFPIDKKRCDVSTLAESNDRSICTYLHARESYDLDVPLSVLRHTYHQCLSELHNFDLNPRRTECLNRLRKKLSKKNPTNSVQFSASSLRQPFFRENLFETAMKKMAKFQEQYCLSKGHDFTKCEAECFNRAANSIAVCTSNIFGRVVSLSKTIITIPYEFTCDGKIDLKLSNAEIAVDSGKNVASPRKTDNKCIKQNFDEIGDRFDFNSSNKGSVNDVAVCSDVKEKTDDSKEITDDSKEISDDSKEISEDNVEEPKEDDDDIDEILKLIGIGEDEENPTTEIKVENTDDSAKISSKGNEAVENFFKLIGVDDASLNEERFGASQSENCDSMNLKVCAYCKKKETRKKMFKKCSRCKEENFPTQHYYCSRDCLLEDWAETHEEEHLRFNKQLS